jgi:glutamate racemase
VSPIGVYDSGVGGLTVLEKLTQRFPGEDFVYFADTAHLPYGDKSSEQIILYSRNIVSWFQNQMQAKLVVAACNTSSSLALDHLLPEFNIPIIGTIYPLLERIHLEKKIGILATQASANSRMHETIFKKHGFMGDVITVACPNFTPLIELGDLDSPELKKCAIEYLEVFKENKIDALIYGCTHYPFIAPLIESLLPKDTQYIDPAEYMTNECAKILPPLPHQKGSVHYFCSSDPEVFSQKLKNLKGVENLVSLKRI